MGKCEWTNASFDYGESKVQKRVSKTKMMDFFFLTCKVLLV